MKINTLAKNLNNSFTPQETTEDLSLMTSFPEMIILLIFFIKRERKRGREEIKSKYSRTLCESHIFSYFLQ